MSKQQTATTEAAATEPGRRTPSPQATLLLQPDPQPVDGESGRRQVSWTDDTIDNEHLGKKKSNRTRPPPRASHAHAAGSVLHIPSERGRLRV